MKSLFETAKNIQDFIELKGWSFCFIGGLAVQYWGNHRLTNDVDLTILTGFGKEEEYVDELLKIFKPRINNAKEFSLTSRVLLLEDSNTVGIDISLGAFDFEESAIARSTYVNFLPDIDLKICSAEDLVVFKCFADRFIDWSDVEKILYKKLDSLDYSYIEKQLIPLLELKEEPEIYEKFEKLKTKIQKSLKK